MQRVERGNKSLEKFENNNKRVIESMSGAVGSSCPTDETVTSVTYMQTLNCSCIIADGAVKTWKNSEGVAPSLLNMKGPFTCQ
jgi:hypothetical protein